MMLRDLTGQKFGRLRVVALHSERMGSEKVVTWECVCDCGVTVIARRDRLLQGNSQSCGCYMQERWTKSVKHLECSVDKCDRPQVAKGLCHKHWKYNRKHGTPICPKPNPKFQDEQERFWSYVNKNGDIHPILGTRCWVWTGALDNNGYATFRRSVKNDPSCPKIPVHRFCLELIQGQPVPNDLEVDHLCKIRNCVNPEHLEAVTPNENKRRSNGVGEVNRQKTYCHRGHLYDEINTIYRKTKTSVKRICKECQKIWITNRSIAKSLATKLINSNLESIKD